MTVEEMINFDVSECVTILNHRIDTEIVNGIYTISQKNEIDFNEEQIKELLLMFKPMQKELATYKKALELMSIHLQRFQDCRCFQSQTWKEYFLKKAGEVND